MKILFLTPWYPHDENPNSGIFIRDQAELARDNDNEVVVIFSTVNYEKFSLSSCSVQRSVYNGIVEYRIVIKQSLYVFNQFNYLLRALWHVWKVTRKFKPDLIQANVSYPSALFALVMNRLFRIPYMVVEHTRITNHFRSAFHRRATIRSLKGATECYAVSNNSAREMSFWIKRDVKVLPNVVDTDRFKVTPFPESVPQIGFLGSMNTPVKGLDILLKALAGIDRDFVVHIGGRGVLYEEYVELAKSLGIIQKCKFYGFVPHAEIPEFMSRLHFFVSSSRYETFGVVIAEAMASGLPVVVSKSGGPNDFVDDESGKIVRVESTDELRIAIAWMLDHYNSYDKEKIAEKIKSRYSRKTIQKKLAMIYADLSRHQ